MTVDDDEDDNISYIKVSFFLFSSDGGFVVVIVEIEITKLQASVRIIFVCAMG